MCCQCHQWRLSTLCMTLFVWIQVKNLQSTARSHMAEVEERLGMVNPCNTATEGEEEELELNPETFSALAEFYKEQEERERRQAEALTGAGGKCQFYTFSPVLIFILIH